MIFRHIFLNMLHFMSQVYSCSQFNNKPLCHRRNRSFIVFKQHDLTIALKIYSGPISDKTAGAIGTTIIGAAAFVLFVLFMGAYVKYSSRRIPVTNVESGHQDVEDPDAEFIINESFPSGKGCTYNSKENIYCTTNCFPPFAICTTNRFG